MDFAVTPSLAWIVPFAIGFLLARGIYRRSPDMLPQPLRTDITDAEIEAAIRAKRTVEALRLYRQRSGCDVREAKSAVEAMARHIHPHGMPHSVVPQPQRTDITNAQIEAEIRAKRLIQAIKLYRERHHCSLKEAKLAVEAMARHIHPHS
jgi:ribosomal protein L7/L12